MNNLKKISYLSLFSFFALAGLASSVDAQERNRVIRTVSSQPVNQPPAAQDRTQTLSSSTATTRSTSKPTLANNITVPAPEIKAPLVKKTASSMAVNTSAILAAGKTAYGALLSADIIRSIQAKLGIPYRYGSTGPNRYDCSGFVWAVFNEAGIPFTRQSARSLWAASEPVSGEDRYKFGTLVFMNGLGHMGIVADENGFYHASSSKGVTYSTFEGYWGKRIVGFRQLPLEMPNVTKTLPAEPAK